MTARTLGLVLSLWLFFSAFAFPRPAESFANAWLVGLIAGVAALAGFHRARARFLDTALGAWLLLAAFLLPRRSDLAFWSDLVVGALLLATSLVPGTLYLTRLERRDVHA